MSKLTRSQAWRELEAHAGGLRNARIADLFAGDAQRATTLSREAADVFLDFSKQRISAETLRLLLALAAQQQVGAGIARMFAGEPINLTENRAAGHVALRAPRHATFSIGG